MKITILAFGIIADLTQQKEFIIQDINNMEELKTLLEQQYPALQNINYSIAVNKLVAVENIIFNENDTIALLPPFSGG